MFCLPYNLFIPVQKMTLLFALYLLLIMWSVNYSDKNLSQILTCSNKWFDLDSCHVAGLSIRNCTIIHFDLYPQTFKYMFAKQSYLGDPHCPECASEAEVILKNQTEMIRLDSIMWPCLLAATIFPFLVARGNYSFIVLGWGGDYLRGAAKWGASDVYSSLLRYSTKFSWA